MLDPPDLEDLDEKSSLFFFATPSPDGFGEAEVDGAIVISWSVEEELCREGDRLRMGGGEDDDGALLTGGGWRGERWRDDGDLSSSRELPRSAH